MSIQPPKAFKVEVPTLPDADFAFLQAESRIVLQKHARYWTDHNTHDPGITMLEAVLFAIADAHYRTRSKSFDTWHVDAADMNWREKGSSFKPDEFSAGQKISDSLLEIHDRVMAANSREAAIKAIEDLPITTSDGSDQLPTDTEVKKLVDRIREPVIVKAMLEAASELQEIWARKHGWVDEPSRMEAKAEVQTALQEYGLWQDEVDALLVMENRRRLAKHMRENLADIVEIIMSGEKLSGTADAGAQNAATKAARLLASETRLKNRFGYLDSELMQVLALAPVPPMEPEDFEDSTGATKIFPPHPLTARTIEPVTAADYRRRLLAIPEVKRAWVLKGVAPNGVGWDGRVQIDADLERQGALTLLIQTDLDIPENGLRRSNFLRRMLNCVLAENWSWDGDKSMPGDFPDTDNSYRDIAAHLESAAPRRLLCDEIGASLVCEDPIAVRLVLRLEEQASIGVVRRMAERLLKGFLSADRASPLEPVFEPSPPPIGASEIDGPWPWAQKPRPGWTPGTPVRPTEIVQLLSSIPGVLGVAQAKIRKVDDKNPNNQTQVWFSEDLEIGSFCVPKFDKENSCLIIQREDGGGCDG